jgi:RNA polymerase sigma-70 factor (ECF subfamily)
MLNVITTLKVQQDKLTSAHRDYMKPLMLYSFSKLQNKALAEDTVQDTFIRTWGFMIKGGEINNMKSFLYKILSNLIVDEYRKRKTTSLDDLIEGGFEPSDEREHADRMINIYDGRMILLLLKRLPPKYREVLSLRFVKNLSIGEISSATLQSKNAVTVQIHRGLKRLRLFVPELQLMPSFSSV